MKRTIVFVISAALLQVTLVGSALGNPNDAKQTAKVRTNVLKLGTGPDARVKVTLRDKSKVEGYVSSSHDTGFVVMSSSSNEPVSVPYSQVKQVKGNNLHTGVKIAIGVGIAIALMLLILNGIDT